MERNHLLQITQELYRLTLLFPKKEPLRFKMRDLADDILANCLTLKVKQNPVLEELEILDGFLEVAKAQNWVSPDDVLKIQQEYTNLKEELKNQKAEDNPAPKETESGSLTLASRQEMILAILKEKGKVQVGETKKVFPQISKRTLRRDFRNLLKQGLIERLGEKNDTFYQLSK